MHKYTSSCIFLILIISSSSSSLTVYADGLVLGLFQVFLQFAVMMSSMVYMGWIEGIATMNY